MPFVLLAVLGLFCCFMGLVVGVFMLFEWETAAKEWFVAPISFIFGLVLFAPQVLSYEGERRGLVRFLSSKEEPKALVETRLTLPSADAGPGSLRPLAVVTREPEGEPPPPRFRHAVWVWPALFIIPLPYAFHDPPSVLARPAQAVLALSLTAAVALIAAKLWKFVRLTASGFR